MYSSNLHWRKKLLAIALAIATGVLIILTQVQLSTAEPIDDQKLPLLQPHPLPQTLAQWQDPNRSGDYFEQVKPTPLGYLVWSNFPVKVYVEGYTTDRFPDSSSTLPSHRRLQQWVEAVLSIVEEWQVYLPLAIVEEGENADISILRSSPPLRPSIDRKTGKVELPPARSAEARYEFYIQRSAENTPVLSHCFKILISPDLRVESIKAASRHELGHALGIWGHSSVPTDALYVSQVADPPLISSRDINTLKQVYQQPTRLGWALP